MIELIAHNLAPIMFVTVMGLLLLGYPVALTLAAGGLFFFWVGVELSVIAPDQINLFWPLLKAHPERIYGVMYNETLLAVPFFTFMGIILERSGMAEDLLDTIGQLFGPVRGGLAYAVILVGALLAATTGVVAASVMAMGLISLPIMMRYGYHRPLAAGTIAASGSLAQIVPPSLVLIVMADQLGVSVGDMYVGALLPAALMIGIYLLYIFVLTLVKPEWAPALPREARTLGDGVWSLVVMLVLSVGVHFATFHTVFAGLGYEVRFVWSATTATVFALAASLLNRHLKLNILSNLAERVIIVLIPPLALIFLVLGTIFLGIATPTEGGAMGASGALVLALFKRRLTFSTLNSALLSTAKLSSFVMFILIGARVFGLTFYGVNGNVWIEELLLQLPGGQLGFLVAVTIIVFILGCFLDFFEIAFIMVPLLVPVAETLGIDLVWFGIILGINLQASFLTPPFGFALFYLRSIAPMREWKDEATGKMMPPVKTLEIYRGAVPFIIIQVALVLVVIAFPQLVTHYKGQHSQVDPDSITIEVPDFGAGGGLQLPSLGGDNSGGLPGLTLPPLGSEGGDSSGSGGGGTLGLPPLTFGNDQGAGGESSEPTNEQTAPSGGFDLSQPPKFD
jgi:TRAP-type mannitol/chloroaromatic compound transport system permease large subunit